MKFPFYTILGPPLRRDKKFIRFFCRHPLLSISNFYTGILGVLGVVLSLYDIFIIMKCKSFRQGHIWRTRVSKRKIFSTSIERDLKLFGLLISFNYYLGLILGILSENATFFLPFLFLYSFIIPIEFLTFLSKVIIDGFNFNKFCLGTSIFIIYNWLCVFCVFTKLTTICDF